uniref:Conserved oligomeric Golgi complex subunit 8 n=1 Tax=Heterorhabditis bacteriophora TaxID=37862 RepID=A0A1I7WMR4_HETBA
MDLCIRAGYYEAAYSLTNYGMTLQQHSIIKNPLIKNIADRLVEARSFLLDELFNKFSGPLDLAASIQVVNNVRKMPYLTSSQLRISVLQHRDIYLDKQILDIMSHPEYAIRAIEIYRDCMYDTLVLYLAVFPENEIIRKDPLIDPRWESWPTSPPSTILGQWALRNINRLLEIIQKADLKSSVDMCMVWSKMMSLANSYGRMGLDFRSFILSSLTSMVVDRFKIAVRQVTNRLTNEVKVLSMANGEIGPLPRSELASSESTPIPSLEISMWDDICVYGNGIIEALNSMRYSLSPVLVNSVVQCVRDSIQAVLSWLSTHHQSVQFSRAVKIICLHLAPFLTQCIRFLFPFSTITRLFASTITRQQYDSYTELNISDLANICDGSEKIEEVLLPLLQKKTLADIDLEAVLRKEQLGERAIVNLKEGANERIIVQQEEEMNEPTVDQQKEQMSEPTVDQQKEQMSEPIVVQQENDLDKRVIIQQNEQYIIKVEESMNESVPICETKNINDLKKDETSDNTIVILPSKKEMISSSSSLIHPSLIDNSGSCSDVTIE